MSSNNEKINGFIENFKNIDSISSKLLTEIKYKNEILEDGITDCKECKHCIDANDTKIIQ